MADDQTKNDKGQVSRRTFLKGVVISAASIPVIAAGCSPVEQPPMPIASGYQSAPPPPLNPDVPLAPGSPPSTTMLRTFTAHEARTVEALTARILPGTPDDPGAREAGVVTYIDNMLAYQEGFNESTYREPPYARLYEGDAPPEQEDDYETVWVSAEEIERYGYQSILSPRDVYRLGVAAVDAYAQSEFDAPFVRLSEQQQDSIIEAMVSGEATTGFEQISAGAFFAVLRRHTAEGMFSDPAYGGNRNMVGWQLIGYPGAQRAYTQTDIRTEAHTPRPPQSLAGLHSFSPGEYAGEHVVLPVSGSPEDFPVHHDHP
jgi:gluconate 2-dehydrogenase gamma chain